MKSDLSTQDELNRREFIASAAKACLGVGLLPMAGSFVHNSVSALEPGSRPASARYVIYLNMTGAMSHLDTFGTNPEAADIQGPTKSIRTSADGVILSENLPLTARHMHNAAIIRTMVTSQGAHEQASYLMHTSYLPHVAIALVMLGRSTHKGIGFFTTALGLMIQTKVKMSIETLADAQPTNCSALVSCLEDVFFITGSFKQLINLHHGNA